MYYIFYIIIYIIYLHYYNIISIVEEQDYVCEGASVNLQCYAIMRFIFPIGEQTSGEMSDREQS